MYPNYHQFPVHFQVEGQPAIIFSPRAFPQVFRPQIQNWEVEYDLPKFFHSSERINEAEYQKLTVNVPMHRTF